MNQVKKETTTNTVSQNQGDTHSDTMVTQTKGITTYERDKNKVKISGEPENVKWPIMIDQLTSVLSWLVPVIILVFVLPKVSFLPFVLKWVKQRIFSLILLIGMSA